MWRDIKFILFDAPSIQGKFEGRIKYLKNLCKKLKREDIVYHEHEKCRNREHMEEELKRVEDLGGEGVMLRQPGSLYENRRSDTLLKVKTFKDAEAVVMKHAKGTGRNSAVLGALHVRDSDGITFKIGSGFTDAQRRSPPKIGSTVTYKYQEKTESGKPRFPTFLRVHTDI
jgi:DNA ligase-1